MDVVVVGGGSWGTAFSRLLADHGHVVTLACRDPAQVAEIAETATTRATSRASISAGSR